MSLMDLSEKLAILNHQRFQSFDALPAKAALFLFNGDVYDGLGALSLSADAITKSQEQLRILSGFYGLIRPHDQIRPYRLEMGRPILVGRFKSLPQFWANSIHESLKADCGGDFRHRPLINLASKEYAHAILIHKNAPNMITPRFLDIKDNQAKTISFFAKQARGQMARLILETNPSRPDDIKDLSPMGYRFEPQASGPQDWVFSRPHPT